ncbi:amino acid permease [Trametes versicolor FP-101664 SS1]|uniref:amino acid permease n=1 Tax=Trametes versicolor (strain FP-101664) TaxID=717944 RepID=UPI000462183E|nr:amino acid permease [Trametes versicolor FP-101664 SS1]EIW64731.1 amino acid permease [Trametes versicolor FP-101664 SS1]
MGVEDKGSDPHLVHEVVAEKHLDYDSENQVPVHAEHTLKRQLKNRHIAMISIGGVIGTGLFLGTATSLQQGGPIGLLLGYGVVGTVCYSVMISLGEMVAYLPLPGGHIKLAERFVDPAFSFVMGWNYWYNWTIILPAELSAAAVLINFWNQSVNNAVWITICLVVVITINMFGAGVYGECEFIFASIKVITITGLIILGIVLDLGGGPNHDRLGFRYWKNPGPFVQYDGIAGAKGQFLGFFAVLTQAAFSFIGTEIVAIAAGEAKNPRRNLPKAIKRVYVRILLFYIGGVTIIGLLVPSSDPGLGITTSDAGKSPFVIAIRKAGITGLPSVINAALLTSAWSAASSDLYTSSRALYGLATVGNAPKIFKKVTKNGLPIVSLLTCAAFSTLAYMGVSTGSGRVFGWFVNMTSIAGLMTWFGISVTYVRFYKGFKLQGFDRATLPYAHVLQPYAAWYAIFMCLFICFFSGWAVFLKGKWATDTFVTNYLPLALFPILYIGAKLYFRTPMVRPEDMDFITGLKEIEAETYDEPPPRNWVEKWWQWLM